MYRKLDGLIRIDISLVYPEYFGLIFNFPVPIPAAKVQRLRHKIRAQKIEAIAASSAQTEQILAMTPPVILEPLQIIVPPPHKVYDPISRHFVTGSDYLYEVFTDNYFAYWFGSLVTFYRHAHIRSYDLTWKNEYYAAKNESYHQTADHQDFRILVNNRAKRQIIRAAENDPNLTRFGKIRLIQAMQCLRNNADETVQCMTQALHHLGFSIQADKQQPEV